MENENELCNLIDANKLRKEMLDQLLNPILSVAEVALLLGVCKVTIRRWTINGKLKSIRSAGNHRRFYLQDILEFMNTGG